LLLDVILPTENEYYKQQAAGLIYYSKAISTNIINIIERGNRFR
jgi:hypothetical protein